MDADDLLCASCGSRVGEARCATCRASRARLHAERPQLPAGPVLLLALVLVLLLLALT